MSPPRPKTKLQKLAAATKVAKAKTAAEILRRTKAAFELTDMDSDELKERRDTRNAPANYGQKMLNYGLGGAALGGAAGGLGAAFSPYTDVGMGAGVGALAGGLSGTILGGVSALGHNLGRSREENPGFDALDQDQLDEASLTDLEQKLEYLESAKPGTVGTLLRGYRDGALTSSLAGIAQATRGADDLSVAGTRMGALLGAGLYSAGTRFSNNSDENRDMESRVKMVQDEINEKRRMLKRQRALGMGISPEQLESDEAAQAAEQRQSKREAALSGEEVPAG